MKKTISLLLICILLVQAVPALALTDGEDNGGTEMSDIIVNPDTTEETTISESETTLPYTTVPDVFGETVIGELKDGYKLCYFFLPPPPWMHAFYYNYGKYFFLNFNGTGEQYHCFYVKKDDEKLMLSQAFEKGITDIDEVVSLIKTSNVQDFCSTKIINAEENPGWKDEYKDYYFEQDETSAAEKTEPRETTLPFTAETAETEANETTEPTDSTTSTAVSDDYTVPETECTENITVPESSAAEEVEPTAPETTMPETTAPTTVKPKKNAPKSAVEKYTELIIKDNKKYTEKDITVDLFKKLKGNIYLVHHRFKDGLSNEVVIFGNIDKYFYKAFGSAQEVYIYDAKANKKYSLITAYNNGVISKENLKTVSKTLSGKKNLATFKENIVKINAGAKTPMECLSGRVKGSSAKISNKKIVKLSKDKNGEYIFTGLKKGTAKVTFTPKKGKQYSVKIIVKTSPKFTNKKGKKISSVTVKKGKTVKVFVKGKAKEVNNKYKNTKKAKIISKKSASTLKIKGLKKGKTTLSVTVNGVKLNLKVKVK